MGFLPTRCILHSWQSGLERNTAVGIPQPWQNMAASSVEDDRMVMLHDPPQVAQAGCSILNGIFLLQKMQNPSSLILGFFILAHKNR